MKAVQLRTANRSHQYAIRTDSMKNGVLSHLRTLKRGVICASWLLAQCVAFANAANDTDAHSAESVTGVTVDHVSDNMVGGEYRPPVESISASQREAIFTDLQNSRAELQRKGLLSSPGGDKLWKQITPALNFDWPLRQADGRTDNDYFGISNFIDEDPTYPSHLLDYSCGARTYDTASGYNHAGTDIFTWPFGWNKMDNSDVEIIAGAAGTILGKADGNFDRSCSMNSGASWNAVYVQHSDGSVAWYGHMKKGSVTAKPVGASVAAGEYLGIVGSSGSSTGPHLHLELYDAANNLIDPWLGSCNAKSKLVTWASQRPYFDPKVNALTIGMAAPVFPSCPTQETSNHLGYVTPGALGYFTVYARDQRSTDPITLRWYKPDGSLWKTGVSGTPSTFYAASYWYWSWYMPSTPTGIWRLEATMNGNAVSQTFVVGALSVPGAPTIGIARASDRALSVAFSPPSSNGGGTIDNYRVTCTGGKTAYGTTSPIVVTELTNGSSYSCTVAAHNSVGWSTESASTGSILVRGPIAKPVSPTIAVVQIRQGGADFILSMPTSDGWPILSYAVSCTAPGQATVSATSTTATVHVSGLKKDVPYFCTATASNASYTSNPSTASTVTTTLSLNITPVLILLLD